MQPSTGSNRRLTLPSGAVHLAGDTYYVPGVTNAGFIGGLSIDTHPEESVYEGIAVDTAAITHGHADHFSSAPCLRRAGARILAARDDASLIENPEVNIRGMFSWAKPSDMLVTKLFRGEPCKVDGLVESWTDERATPIALPGHTLGHTGFRTRDRVVFSGDALYLSDLWAKHRLPYAIDPALVADSLETLRDVDFEVLVPGHGRPVGHDEALEHIDFHLGQLQEIETLIIDRLEREMTTEEAVAFVSADRGLSDNPAQYWLAVTTVKGFLGELLGRGEIEFFVRDHAGWWKKKA